MRGEVSFWSFGHNPASPPMFGRPNRRGDSNNPPNLREHPDIQIGQTRMRSGNIFADVPDTLGDEQFLELYSSPKVKIERIVSTGQASPPRAFGSIKSGRSGSSSCRDRRACVSKARRRRERCGLATTSSFRLISGIEWIGRTRVDRPYGSPYTSSRLCLMKGPRWAKPIRIEATIMLSSRSLLGYNFWLWCKVAFSRQTPSNRY